MSDRHYRDCLSRFATGVTLMTCRRASGEAAVMTVNSFASVSLEPRLILWSIARHSRCADAFLDADGFAVNVLARDQEALSRHFAQTERPEFADLECRTSARGYLLLDGCLAWLECARTGLHEGGDHYIVVGTVEHAELGREAPPLLYYRSTYRSLT